VELTLEVKMLADSIAAAAQKKQDFGTSRRQLAG